MNIAIILSGGTGRRIGLDIPKQYVEVNGRPMIDFCLETFLGHPEVDAVWIVADKAWREYILRFVSRTEDRCGDRRKFRAFSAPGANRQLSIYHALTDMGNYAEADDTVIIHDAARPFVKAEQISRCLKGMMGCSPCFP